MALGDQAPVSRSARRSARRRQVLRRRRLTLAGAVAVVVAIVAVVVVAGHARGHPGSASAVAHTGGRRDAPPATTTTAATTTLPPTTTTTTTDPGALPQTPVMPTTDASFTARMGALWSGVTTGTAQEALPAFFPEAAYVQLKSLASPQSDYTGRLVTEYEDDVTAAHQLLGPSAATAALVGVNVDAAYAHWVPPGDCYNTVGYYEVPNARVVYTVGGQTDSFGIASMISWRGEWYVVHLGAVLRDGGGGEVDDPQSGPGESEYSGTC